MKSTPNLLDSFLTLDDFEQAAKQKLSSEIYEYYRGGAGEESTLKQNCAAFQEYKIWPRVLIDVSKRDLSIEMLGTKMPHPIFVAPTAYHKLAHPEGEMASVQGAKEAGSLFVLSTLSSFSLEEVATASPATKWFQLYFHRDRTITQTLVERAQKALYQALVVTVDAPVLSRRISSERAGFSLPKEVYAANFIDPKIHSVEQQNSFLNNRHDPKVTWKDIEWLQSITSLPILLKGILHPEDAKQAVSMGISGIIISNHGGRQLDYTPTSLTALEKISALVPKDYPLLVDGGIRSGIDIFKALALGAKAILVGRPVLWGLAAFGSAGVACVLKLFQEELSMTMALAGCSTLAEITTDRVKKQNF